MSSNWKGAIDQIRTPPGIAATIRDGVSLLEGQLDAVDGVLQWKGTGFGRVGAITFLMQRSGINEENMHAILCDAHRLIQKQNQEVQP